MCLGIPAKILEVNVDGSALVDYMGVRWRVGTSLVEHVAPGDYVMVHAGEAIERVDLATGKEVLRMWEDILKAWT